MKKIPTAPLNVVYVQIKKKLYDSKKFPSGIILYKDTSFHPEEASMIEATVVSLPRAIQERFDYAGMYVDAGGPLQVGSTVLMRYDVVFHYFNQPERDTPIYKNVLLYEGEEYWRVDIQQIFAVLRKGSVEMINGYVMVDPVTEQVNFNSFHAATHFATRILNDQYAIRYIGHPLEHEPALNLRTGDRVHVRPGIAQHYETDWSDFHIIKQSQILAKVENLS